MNSLLKKSFLLLFSLLTIILSASAKYTTVVAGTDFEPESDVTGFFIKDKSGGDNSKLKFHNGGYIDQDIEVCDNKKIYDNGGKLYFLNNNPNFSYGGNDINVKDAYGRAKDKKNLKIHEYIVSTPVNVEKVGGLKTKKNNPNYSNKWMFITKTYSGPSTSILFYTLKNPQVNTNFKVEVGFANIADVSGGNLSVKLRTDVFGVKNNKYTHLDWKEWFLNTDQTHIIKSDKTKEFNSGTYEEIVVVVKNDQSFDNHILGIDFINVYSEYELNIEIPDAPTNKGYNECPTSEHAKKYYKDLVDADLTKGYLSFYKKSNKTQPIAESDAFFYIDESQSSTIYYTYTDNATRKQSKVGTLKITVKPNPTITLSSDIKNNAITECNAREMNLAASASVANGSIREMKWSLANETRGVYISEQTTSGGATVAFDNGTGCIFGTADAIFTATTGDECTASKTVVLTNRDCSGLTFTSSSSKPAECEGNEITYTFTLKNELGYTSEDIDVTLVLPESGFTVSKDGIIVDKGDEPKEDSSNKNTLIWHLDELLNDKSAKITIKGTAQVEDSEAISEDFTLTAYVSRVGKSTYDQINTNVIITAQTVVVYNTASTPAFDMDDKTTISQCNDGTFEIVAKTPAIGEGEWTIAPNQDEELIKDVKVELKDPKVSYEAIVTGVPLGESVFIRWTVTNGVCKDENNFVDIELKNDDCTKIDIDSDASLSSDPSKTEVCEGSEVTYTFTLTNKTGVDSENIEVKFELPNELTLLEENAITYTAGIYRDGRWIVSKLPFVENPTAEDKPTLTIKGTVELSDETIQSKKVEVTGTIVEVAGQTLDPAPTTTSGVTVYNTPSEPKLEMNELTSVAQCNDGEFDIKAAAPAIGNGEWTIAPKQDEELVKDVQISHLDPNKPNEAKVTGVPLGKTVKVRWTVTNGVCDDADNFAELALTNNNCTTFEPSVDDAEVATCYGTDATFTFTVKNTATVAVKNVKLSLSLESGLALQKASVGDIQFDENNQCVIPTMDSYETVTITVVATATVDKAKATISVIESSGVTVNGVSVSKPVTVYDLPEVSFAKLSSTICIDEQDKEKTKVQVNFTKGKPNFKISYTVGEKEFNDIPVEGNTYSIEEPISADATITIDKVVDSYRCTATDFGAIKHEVETKKHATLAQLGELEDTCEGDTLSLSAPAVTENGSTVSNQKWMLNEQEFATTTKLDFDAHNGQSIYYQVTSSCNGKTREIKTEPVTVTVINSNVAFDLVVADDKILTAGEKAQITVVPVEKEAESYQWFANDKELPINGLEFNDYLYLNTEFKVIANGRCGTADNKTTIEVVWPTAFTPYNGNGKNDDFARGLPIIVFNRFYTKIYEGNDGWDGTINGTMNESESIAVPGVYYYSVLLPNGEVKKGTIEIIKID